MKNHGTPPTHTDASKQTQTRKFYPDNHYQCTSSACRRARKCLGRAYICGCIYNHVAVGTHSDAEKQRLLRTALKRAIKRHERCEARKIAAGEPVEEDVPMTPEEQEALLVAEIKEKLGAHDED